MSRKLSEAARVIKGELPLVGAALHLATVTAIDNSTFTVTVQVDGSGTSSPDTPYLTSYHPVVSDTVIVLTSHDADLVIGTVINQGWTTVSSFANGWSNYGTPSDNVSYRRHGPFVSLRGAIKNGTLNQPAFTLPTGFRPTAQRYFAVVANQAFGALRVDNNGDVVPTVGDTTWITLDSVTYLLG